jgi:uncharacterized protein YhbP (UPF0306 family)
MQDEEFIRDLIQRNRYLTLATAENSSPWVATLEYLTDEALNFYFFSPTETLHARQLQANPKVAVSIYDAQQPEYEPAPAIRISGVQFSGEARMLESPFPDLIRNQIEAWQLPMPPYAVFVVTPGEWYLPVIDGGVNTRAQVQMS